MSTPSNGAINGIEKIKRSHDHGVLDSALTRKYEEDSTHAEREAAAADNVVKLDYIDGTKAAVKRKEWLNKKRDRDKAIEEDRELSTRRHDQRRFSRDRELLREEKFSTVIVNNRGVIAREAIEDALRKGYRVVCFYTDADKGASYLNPENYKDKIIKYASDLGLDPKRYEDSWKKRFKAVRVESHTIKLKNTSFELVDGKPDFSQLEDLFDSEGNPKPKWDTLAKFNPNLASIAKGINEAALFSEDISENGLGFFSGYGYDSENADFVRFIETIHGEKSRKDNRNKVYFIGANSAVMEKMGDKGKAFEIADAARVNRARSSDFFGAEKDDFTEEEKLTIAKNFIDFAEKEKLSLIRIKCTNGGGGRGQAKVEIIQNDPKGNLQRTLTALSKIEAEAKQFGGKTRIFVEKEVSNAIHVEAQVNVDEKGNIKIRGLRNCSGQIDSQKINEMAIRPDMLPRGVYEDIVHTSKRLLGQLEADGTPYRGVGTLEFLVDEKGEIYFMEMNTRIQVEHGVTAIQTNDSVIGDALDIAQGRAMRDKDGRIDAEKDPGTVVVQARINAYELGLKNEDVKRLASEGILEQCVLPTGEGVHVKIGIEAGDRQTTMTDSMVFIILAEGFNEEDAVRRMTEALKKTRIEGFKTNLPMMRKVYEERYQELFNARREGGRAPRREHIGFFSEKAKDYIFDKSEFDQKSLIEKAVKYIAYVSVNGAEKRVPLDSPLRAGPARKEAFDFSEEELKILQHAWRNLVHERVEVSELEPMTFAEFRAKLGQEKDGIPATSTTELEKIYTDFDNGKIGFKEIIKKYGADRTMWEILPAMKTLYTDTTTRDGGGQSNFATRLRNADALFIQAYLDEINLFSAEVGGGATADVDLIYLMQNPIESMRKICANFKHIPSQILWRGLNTVGYGPSSDIIVKLFLQLYANAGVQVFRIFDSMNDFDSMETSIRHVRKMGLVAEGTVCYTGGLTDETQEEYKVDFYLENAKKLVRAGAHSICIKDMAGLMIPNAATALFEAFRKDPELQNIPLHFHTHDTLKTAVSASVNAIKAGVNIVDVAGKGFAGGLGQPEFESVVYELAAFAAADDYPQTGEPSGRCEIGQLREIASMTARKIWSLNARMDCIREETLSKLGSGKLTEDEKNSYLLEIKKICIALKHERNDLVNFFSKNEEILKVDPKFKKLFKNLTPLLEQIRQWYLPWEGGVDAHEAGDELSVIFTSTPGGMFSNFKSQIREQHLEKHEASITRIYARLRWLWGNMPLVTPSSKYVGDQSVACAEKLISTIGDKAFEELMSGGVENISISTLFGDGEYLLDSTLSLFTGNLGKHPNQHGEDTEWKAFQVFIGEQLQKRGFKIYDKPVNYYQDTTTGERFSGNLETLSQYGSEKVAVDLFVGGLNQQGFSFSPENLKAIGEAINHISKERADEIENLAAQQEGDFESYCKTTVEKAKSQVEDLQGQKKLIETQIAESINQPLEKIPEILASKKSRADFGIDEATIDNYKKIQKRILELSELQKKEEKLLVDFRSSKQKKVTAEQIRAAINYVRDFDTKSLADAVRGCIDPILNSKGKVGTNMLETALEDFVLFSALGKGYDTFRANREKYGLVEQLPTEVFTKGLKIGEKVILRDGGQIYEIEMLSVEDPVDLYKQKSYVRRVSLRIRNTETNAEQIVYSEEIDEKLKSIYAKIFRKASKSEYGPDNNFCDVGAGSSGTIMAPVEKSSKKIGVGSVIYGGDIIMQMDSMKTVIPIKVPEDIDTAVIVAMPASEWDHPAAGDCCAILRKVESAAAKPPLFAHAEKGDKKQNTITAPKDTAKVKMESNKRLQEFRTGELIATITKTDGTQTLVYAPYDCLIDQVFGNGTTEDQSAEEGSVLYKIKNLVKVQDKPGAENTDECNLEKTA